MAVTDLARENLPIQLHWFDATGAVDYSLKIMTVDAAFGDSPTALAVVGKYETTPTQYDNGDAVPLQVDDYGKLNVNAAITLNYSYQDTTAFTVETDFVGSIGGIYEVTPTSVGDGEIGIVRMTADRHLFTKPTNTETDPLFVQVVDEAASGNEIHYYNTDLAIAKNSAGDVTYGPVAVSTLFLLRRVTATASGATKATVSWGVAAGAGVLTNTVEVQFTSSANLVSTFVFTPAVEIPAGSSARVTIRNDSNGAMDVYATIHGNAVPV